MTFSLDTMTKARVLDVRTLAAKDRKPDEPPGAQLLIAATLSSAMLAMFDGYLPGMLYRKASAGKQGKLEGIEGDELTSIGDHVHRMPWVYEQTGCEVVIDRGLGGKRNITLSDCKVHRVSFAPQQGGSVKVQWTVDAPAQTDEVRGKLTGLKATDIELTIEPPTAERDAQGDVEGDTKWPFPKGGAASTEKPPQSATTEVVKDKGKGETVAEHADATQAFIAAQSKKHTKTPAAH